MAAYDSDYGRLALYFREPYRFNFFQAVKLLEAQWRVRLQKRGLPDTEPVGAAPSPEEESVRIQSMVGFGFAPSDVAEIDPIPLDGGPPIIRVNFMGLAGARGPLPLFFTKLIRDRVRMGDTGLRDFLDIFNHRLISLLYQVRQRNRPTLNTRGSDEHPVGRYLLRLGGISGPAVCKAFDALQDPDAGPECAIYARDLIIYCGLLWNRDRSMDGLVRMLGHFFGYKFKGHELRGKWLRLHESERTKLTARGVCFNKLGATTIAGSRIWDAQSGFEITSEPLKWNEFIDFLPIGKKFTSFVKLVNFYTRSAFEFHFKVSVKAEEVFANRPSMSNGGQMRLGWTSWLLGSKAGKDLQARVPGHLMDDL